MAVVLARDGYRFLQKYSIPPNKKPIAARASERAKPVSSKDRISKARPKVSWWMAAENAAQPVGYRGYHSPLIRPLVAGSHKAPTPLRTLS